MNPKLIRVIERYETFHRDRRNKVLHWFGVPLVTFSTLGLAAQLKIGPIDGGMVLFAANFLYFIRLDRTVTIPFFVLNLGVYFIARTWTWQELLPLWLGGWALAIGGHVVFERNSPAFMQNLKETLLGVGPISLFARLFAAGGTRRRERSGSSDKDKVA